MFHWCYQMSLLLFVFLAGCAAEKAYRRVRLDETFALSPTDTVQIRDTGVHFILSLQDVQDNRCPKGVNCITAGKATAVFTVEDQQERLRLCLGGDCPAEQKNNFLVEYNNRWYNVVLEEIVPFPQATGLSGPKQTILKIKRATG